VDICTIQRDVLMTQKYIKELELILNTENSQIKN